MRTLVIDSATEACSLALYDGEAMIAGTCEVLGRGHAERLVPMIADLPNKGRAERIFVSLGPGSFTGVRIGLAAARALGLAWGSQVRGYETLPLVAARAHASRLGPVSVCMSGGHGEWLVQNFAEDGSAEDNFASLAPEHAAERARHRLVAGSQAEALVSLRKAGEALPLLPDARFFAMLRGEFLTDSLAPIYGRPPDARLPA